MSVERHVWPSLLDLMHPLRPDAATRPSPNPTQLARASKPHHARLRVLKPNPRRVPNVARVCRHLGCDLVQFRAAGEPVCVFLGRGFSLLDDSRGMRATPPFRTLESLEYFCQTNVTRFLALEAFPRRPRDWFWNKT